MGLHQYLKSYNTLLITVRSKGISNIELRELMVPPLSKSGSGPLQKSVLHVVKQTTTFPLPGRNAHVVWLSETIVRFGKSVSENIFPSVHPLTKENSCPVPENHNIKKIRQISWNGCTCTCKPVSVSSYAELIYSYG